MKSSATQQFALIFLSGVLAAYIALNALFLLSWVCYVPFFILLNSTSIKQHFKIGAVFGLGVSAFTFFWMTAAGKEFSGNNWFYGLLVTLFSAAVFCVYWIIVVSMVVKLKNVANSKWIKAILIASCFTFGEWLLSLLFSQIPYYLYNSGYGLLDNLYTIQWVAYVGFPFLGFAVVFVNYLVADIVVSKRWNNLLWPVAIILVLMTSGFLMKVHIDKGLVSGKPIKVAIAAENIPANLRWDENGGNILAQRLLAINKQAATLNPDIVLWSESTIPWSYKPNDDLLLEILKEPYSSNPTHVIGFVTAYSKDRMFNSAYAIATNGKVLGRYDKQYLLDFIETPLLGLNMPFLDLDGYLIQKGERQKTIITPKGKAGVIICNEVVVPKATTVMVKNGAEFLLNLSNDGWFKNSYIVNIHFLYAKLSAVINRKDIVLNSNNGISGQIKANGEVLLKRKSNEMFADLALVNPNNYNHAGKYFPNLIPFFSFFCVLGGFSVSLYRKLNQK